MESLFYIMAILGCGEGDEPCRELAIAAARYESREACMAATAAELARRRDEPWPVVVAQCRAADAPVEPLRGSEVLLPEAPARRSR